MKARLQRNYRRIWRREPGRTLKDFWQCLHRGQAYLHNNLIRTKKIDINGYQIVFDSLLDYAPDTEYLTSNIDVTKMQVSCPDYQILSFSLDKSRCVTRSWNTNEMSCDTSNKYTALPQYADANELSGITDVGIAVQPQMAASMGSPTNLLCTDVRHGREKGGISTGHDRITAKAIFSSNNL